MGKLRGWFAVGAICVAIAGCSAAAPSPSASGGDQPQPTTEHSPSASPFPLVCSSPLAARPSAAEPARAEDTGGQFRLALELPRVDWKASDAITGLVTLAYLGSGEVKVGLSSNTATVSYDEVGGCRHMGGVDPADLTMRPISPDKPITTPLAKTLAVMGGDPNASFYISWIAGDTLHLPAGDWIISATVGPTGADVDHLPELANLPALTAAVTVHVTN